MMKTVRTYKTKIAKFFKAVDNLLYNVGSKVL